MKYNKEFICIGLMLLVHACSPSPSTQINETPAIIDQTSVVEITTTTERIQLPSSTEEKTSSTNVSTLTNIPVSSATPRLEKAADSATTTPTTVVAELALCNQKIVNNCIYTIRPAANKTIFIYFNFDQKGAVEYYLVLDGKRYEMEPIAGYGGKKFVCPNIPADYINRTAHLQIFTSESSVPFLEGDIFIDKAILFPTETPKPPDPYGS